MLIDWAHDHGGGNARRLGSRSWKRVVIMDAGYNHGLGSFRVGLEGWIEWRVVGMRERDGKQLSAQGLDGDRDF